MSLDRTLILFPSEKHPTNPPHSYVWPNPWGPSFRNSYGICIACAGLTILMAIIYRFHLASLNKRIDKEEEENGNKTKFRFTL